MGEEKMPAMSQGHESATVSRREWLSLQNFGWKRVLGDGYIDRLTGKFYFDITREATYTYDPHLSALYNAFTIKYGAYNRLKKKSRRGFWNFLWSLIVSAVLICGGLVCASLANFFVPASIGETALSLLKITADSLPAENILKIVGIVLLAVGALLFLLYTVVRTMIVIPVKKKKARETTIESMMTARRYITQKKRRNVNVRTQTEGRR